MTFDDSHYILILAIFGAMIYVPATTFPVQNFESHREVAVILSSAGSTISYVVLPPLMTELLTIYPWREANIFIAAICLQVCSQSFRLFCILNVKALRKILYA